MSPFPDQNPKKMVVNIVRSGYDVYIGRGSPWGNPFKIGEHGSRKQVIAMYEKWIQNQPALMSKIPELKGKVLGCFCSPLQCHGEILVKLANKETRS